jgi:hypothetical protein
VLCFGSNVYSGFVTPFLGDPKSSKDHFGVFKHSEKIKKIIKNPHLSLSRLCLVFSGFSLGFISPYFELEFFCASIFGAPCSVVNIWEKIRSFAIELVSTC